MKAKVLREAEEGDIRASCRTTALSPKRAGRSELKIEDAGHPYCEVKKAQVMLAAPREFSVMHSATSLCLARSIPYSHQPITGNPESVVAQPADRWGHCTFSLILRSRPSRIHVVRASRLSVHPGAEPT